MEELDELSDFVSGSAGLAAAAENESMKTQGLIITALAEAVAIYGIVVALLILGS